MSKKLTSSWTAIIDGKEVTFTPSFSNISNCQEIVYSVNYGDYASGNSILIHNYATRAEVEERV